MALELTGARIIDCSTFRDMVCCFENMRYLSLSGTFYVKSDAVSALAKAGQQLQEVWSGFSPSVSAAPLPPSKEEVVAYLPTASG